MSEIVLKIENLSKQYRLGLVGTGTFSHDLNRWWHKMLNKEDPYLKIGEVNKQERKGNSDYVWALKDINFEVNQGEVLGVIGKNGAGKSTLLKILSKVTGPSTGKIKAKGRIASLLEIGTGFHPELTGRENIFLNGAILGMTRKEIKLNIDEIISFAGIERYVDTPVKRYSSGMRVRLGFAVAAFLNSEILIVDEVLAVGDAEFQKKAIGKMHDVSKGEGRTVLFVSHNMGSIESLCNRCLLLDSGMVKFHSHNTKEVIEQYLQYNKIHLHEDLKDRKDRKGNGDLRFTNLKLKNRENNIVSSGEDLVIELEYKKNIKTELNNIRIKFHFYDGNGNLLFICNSNHFNTNYRIDRNKGKILCTVKNLPLNIGIYSISVYARGYLETLDFVENAFELIVEEGDFYGTGRLPMKTAKFLVKSKWD